MLLGFSSVNFSTFLKGSARFQPFWPFESVTGLHRSRKGLIRQHATHRYSGSSFTLEFQPSRQPCPNQTPRRNGPTHLATHPDSVSSGKSHSPVWSCSTGRKGSLITSQESERNCTGHGLPEAGRKCNNLWCVNEWMNGPICQCLRFEFVAPWQKV